MDLNGVYTRFWRLFNGPIPEVMSPVEYIECQSLKIVHKIQNDNFPLNKEIFRPAHGPRNIQSQSITRPMAKNAIRKESFSVRVIEDWNNMDQIAKRDLPVHFASYCKSFALNKHRGDVVPNNRERISQRTPYFWYRPTFIWLLKMKNFTPIVVVETLPYMGYNEKMSVDFLAKSLCFYLLTDKHLLFVAKSFYRPWQKF